MGHLWSWFRGIKGKLLLIGAFSMLAFGLLGIVSMSGTNTIVGQLHSAHDNIIPNSNVLGEMRSQRATFGYNAYFTVHQLEHQLSTDESLTATKNALEKYKISLKDYADTPFTEEENAEWKKNEANFAAIVTTMERILSALEKKSPEGTAEASKLLTTDYVTHGAAVGPYTAASFENFKKRAQAEAAIADATEKSVKFWLFFIIFAGGGLSILSLIYIAHSLTKVVSTIAAKLSSSSSTVTSSVEQLNEAGNTLSQSSTEAAASLEETVASLEELSSMVKMNSDNAKQAASLSVTSREAAEKGQQEINSLISAMTTISSSSKKIEEIISVIDDIAFQTNLLALNASVEAARAGEQGKGFAVVAEAVRALAQRSAAAAKDITGLIKESVSEVEHGSRIASQSGVVLNNIVTSVKKVSDLNNEIASASSEQTSGIQQISKAMNQLDQASQSNAASAEEISATSGEISSLAVTTQNLTEELSLIIHGAGAKEAASLENHHGHKEGKAKSKPKVFTKSTGLATMKHQAKVISMPKKATAKDDAADMIPFDDEEPRAKVGTTDGF